MSWKKINTRKILSHPRLSVYEDTVLLPGGQKTDYIHFGKRNDAAMIIPARGDGKILVQKEYAYPLDRPIYQFPGGTLENGDTAEIGAARELAEEAQLKGRLTNIGWYYLNIRRTDAIMHVFVATDLVPTSAESDLEEEFEDFWFSKEQINKMISENKLNNQTLIAAWSIYLNSKAV